MRTSRPRAGSALTLTGLALAALALTACSGGSSAGAAKATSAGKASVRAPVGGALTETRPSGRDQAAGSAGSVSNQVSIGPTRIVTADLTVEVRPSRVDATADRATSLALAAGGDLAGDRRSHSGGTARADLVLKVPPARYLTVLDQLARLGTEVSRSAQEQDVTDQVVDVAARITAQQASVDRVTKLLASARNLADIVQIEGELARRQGDLESLQARQRALDGQTSAATITLHLRGQAAGTAPAEPATGFAAGLAAGWSAFTAGGALLLTAAGAALPFAVTFGVLAVAVLAARRRRQAAPAEHSTAAAPTP